MHHQQTVSCCELSRLLLVTSNAIQCYIISLYICIQNKTQLHLLYIFHSISTCLKKTHKLSAHILSKLSFTISDHGQLVEIFTSYLASTASQTRMVESHDPLNLGKGDSRSSCDVGKTADASTTTSWMFLKNHQSIMGFQLPTSSGYIARFLSTVLGEVFNLILCWLPATK